MGGTEEEVGGGAPADAGDMGDMGDMGGGGEVGLGVSGAQTGSTSGGSDSGDDSGTATDFPKASSLQSGEEGHEDFLPPPTMAEIDEDSKGNET